MRLVAALALLGASSLLASASAPIAPAAQSPDVALGRARAEASAAVKRLAQLEARAGQAETEAAKLHAEQIAAAAAIEAAEAKISESDAELRVAQSEAARVEQRLATRRAPLSALLAGLATMGRQPPLLTIADHGSVNEMVRVRALLDTTMPVIQRRSAALNAELTERRRLAGVAANARAELARDRDELADHRERFAELETRAARRAERLAGEAFGAGDRVLASDEALALATGEAAEQRAARAAAAELLRLGLAPPRPMRGDSALPAADFAYSLPIQGRLSEGLGSVNRAGIISRGLRIAASRGERVIAPADGRIAFAAPFRGQDGVVIINHDDGWTSLLLNVASDAPKGAKVRRGEPLGRALGPVGIELRRKGVPVSPALIAASSVPLSNSGDNR